jgi:hypothetical protein
MMLGNEPTVMKRRVARDKHGPAFTHISQLTDIFYDVFLQTALSDTAMYRQANFIDLLPLHRFGELFMLFDIGVWLKDPNFPSLPVLADGMA